MLLAVSVRGRCLETSILLLQSFFIELSLFRDHTLYLFLGSTKASGFFRSLSLLETSSGPTRQSECRVEALNMAAAAQNLVRRVLLFVVCLVRVA